MISFGTVACVSILKGITRLASRGNIKDTPLRPSPARSAAQFSRISWAKKIGQIINLVTWVRCKMVAALVVFYGREHSLFRLGYVPLKQGGVVRARGAILGKACLASGCGHLVVALMAPV